MKTQFKLCLLSICLFSCSTIGLAQRDLILYKEATELSDKGEIEPAIALYTRAIGINSRYVEAYFDRARCYINLGKYSQANEDLEMALKIDSTYGQAYNAHGMLAFRNKNYPRALFDYNKAIEFDSLNCEAYNNRAVYFLAKKDYKPALQDMIAAIEIGKKTETVKYYFYTNLSDVYFHLAEYNKAIEEANRAIEMDGTLRDAYECRAQAYKMLEKFDEANQDLKTAKKLKSSKIYNAN